MKNLIKISVLPFILITLTGCSDLFGKKVVEKPIEPLRPEQQCELEIDEISNILERSIKPTLKCLEAKLEAFVDFEELGQGNSLSRVALANYLKKTEPDAGPKMQKIIESVFEINHLISGESKDFISRESIKKIVNLGIIFNEEASTHFEQTFNSEAPASLQIHRLQRERIFKAAQRIQSTIKDIYKPWRGGVTHSVNILKLVDSFLSEDETDTMDKIQGVLFGKRIILSGNAEVLTHQELGRLFSNFPELLTLLFDAVRYQHLELDQIAHLNLIHDDIQALSGIIFDPNQPDRSKEKMFDLDEAINGVQAFMDEKDSLTKLRALFHEAMKILLQKEPEANLDGEPFYITGDDIEKIFSHGLKVTSKGLAFHRMYQLPQFQSLMNSPQSLNLDYKEFEQYFPGETSELKDFVRIVNNYRFQKGTNDFAYYTIEHKRNVQAFVEVAGYEYGIKLAFRYYGSSLSMSAEQLKALFVKFENELIETGLLYPRRARGTSETIALLGSLFQYQSDNNKVLDVNEATEFVISLTTGIKASKEIHKYLVAEGCPVDQFDRIEPGCFKRRFFNGICKNYRQYLPRMFEYLSLGQEGCGTNFETEHNLAYLNATSRAARTCNFYPDNQEEIYYSEGDMMSIIVAMMHIETTILRWDANLNNRMDPDEVMDAYDIYEPAIQGMLPKLPEILDKPWIVKLLAKQVYKYLVMYEEPPNLKWPQLLKTIEFLLSFDKKAPAYRKTIASILAVVGDESKKKSIAAGEPQFDCNWLRDPENIPRD